MALLLVRRRGTAGFALPSHGTAFSRWIMNASMRPIAKGTNPEPGLTSAAFYGDPDAVAHPERAKVLSVLDPESSVLVRQHVADLLKGFQGVPPCVTPPRENPRNRFKEHGRSIDTLTTKIGLP